MEKYLGKSHFAAIKQRDNQQKEHPLTERDRELLAVLTARYDQLGRSPTKAEVPEADEIKARFGFWKNALSAAGLPPLTDPVQQKLRQAEKRSEP